MWSDVRDTTWHDMRCPTWHDRTWTWTWHEHVHVHLMSWHAMSWHVMHVMTWHGMMSWHVMHFMSCISCHACHAMLCPCRCPCHVMLCMSCQVMSCHAIEFSTLQSSWQWNSRQMHASVLILYKVQVPQCGSRIFPCVFAHCTCPDHVKTYRITLGSLADHARITPRVTPRLGSSGCAKKS